MAVDSVGNSYVTGSRDWPNGGRECTTIKYAPDGTELWVARYVGPSDQGACGFAIAVDNQGNVFVGCDSNDGASHDKYATIKYSPDGQERWAALYSGSPAGEDVISLRPMFLLDPRFSLRSL